MSPPTGPLEVRPRPRPNRAPTSMAKSELAIYIPLIALAAIGVLSATTRNIAPATVVLEMSFLLATLLTMGAGKLRKRALPILLLAAIYVVSKYAIMDVYRPADDRDFVQAYKAFLYLVPLAFFVGRREFRDLRISRVTTLLLFAFLIKYSYAIVLGLDHRPGIYTENNFELILLVGLVYLSYPSFSRSSGFRFLMLVAIVLLSGSRSAAVAMAVAYGFLHLRPRQRHFFAHAAIALALLALVAVLFSTRSAGSELASLDRYTFLQVFLREVGTWPVWQLATGSLPLTPLSPASCFQLAYYEKLFSFSDTATCYSVVLHSFFLRAIFDHGLIGLALLYGALWFGLRESGYSKRDRLGLLSIVSASALSVSAFNSIYVAILFAIALALRRDTSHAPRDGSREIATPRSN